MTSRRAIGAKQKYFTPWHQTWIGCEHSSAPSRLFQLVRHGQTEPPLQLLAQPPLPLLAQPPLLLMPQPSLEHLAQLQLQLQLQLLDEPKEHRSGGMLLTTARMTTGTAQGSPYMSAHVSKNTGTSFRHAHMRTPAWTTTRKDGRIHGHTPDGQVAWRGVGGANGRTDARACTDAHIHMRACGMTCPESSHARMVPSADPAGRLECHN